MGQDARPPPRREVLICLEGGETFLATPYSVDGRMGRNFCGSIGALEASRTAGRKSKGFLSGNEDRARGVISNELIER